ncbi:MAG TPA: ABC transporter permease [Pilimelia sp.]|nr:ABC transporter permease [Pilimelia sp.]
MRPATLLRLAYAGGRADRARLALTGCAAALATLLLLAAGNVAAIGTHDGSSGHPDGWSTQYASPLLREPGLRPGVIAALLLLALPVLALAGQAARLGAPARDRRLAALRLAGATPGQVTAVGAVESGLAAALGTACATLGYLVTHAAVDWRTTAHGHQVAAAAEPGRVPPAEDAAGRAGILWLPTDVLPPPWAVLALALVVPGLAVLLARLTLRRVAASPLCVVRRLDPMDTHAGRLPGWIPLVLGALGVGIVFTLPWWVRHLPRHAAPLVVVVVVVGCVTVGLVGGVGALSYRIGRAMHRLARRPATLLAARQLQSDPWRVSRSYATLFVTALLGGCAFAFRQHLLAAEDAQRISAARFGAATGTPVESSPPDPLYLDTMRLIDVALLIGVVIVSAGLLVAVVEELLTRRRAYASVVAAGVPRAVLARAVLWRMLAPCVPGVLLAMAVGVGITRAVLGPAVVGEERARVCPGGGCGSGAGREVVVPQFEVPAVVPWADLSIGAAVAISGVTLAVGAGLLFLRASTDLAEARAE